MIASSGVLLVIALLVVAFLIGLRIFLRPGGKPPRTGPPGQGPPAEDADGTPGDDDTQGRQSP